MNPYQEFESAEIKLLRAINELNHRILHSPSLDERNLLRSVVATIRQELVNLIESMSIHSEEDVRRAHTGQGLALVPLGSS